MSRELIVELQIAYAECMSGKEVSMSYTSDMFRRVEANTADLPADLMMLHGKVLV